MKGFDSRLYSVIDIIPVEFGPVVGKTHIIWHTILSNAISGIASEIALAI
jgi:hypothetical protein